MTALALGGRGVNDFFHDVAAGLFPGAVLAAWAIHGALEANAPGSGSVIHESTGGLWLLFGLGLLVSVGTGLFRLHYWRLNVRSGFLETKKTVAALKHLAFVTLLVLSAWSLASL